MRTPASALSIQCRSRKTAAAAAAAAVAAAAAAREATEPGSKRRGRFLKKKKIQGHS
jgi:hypothetical protein